MEEISNDLDLIEIRHRKEKKELQAKIQALKKTIKGDKTKKKELTSEIVRLESELENRHKQEFENVNNVISTNEEEILESSTSIPEISKQKVSKAQKRRDKKSQQEKERQIQIKLQEEENLFGPRNTEIQAITSILIEKHLKLFSIPSDGDCLYRAVAHQLEKNKAHITSVGDLRKTVANYIRNNKDEFMPFMSNPDSNEILNDIEFEEYCNKVECTKAWGGQLEIRALSNSLQCPIHVIQAIGPNFINQGDEFDGPPLIITYHRHMYQLGEHYNSTEIPDNEKIS